MRELEYHCKPLLGHFAKSPQLRNRMHTDHTLDARGLNCPMPLLKAKQKINQMQVGETLQVLSTDPGSMKDFASFMALTSHELLESEEIDGEFRYIIRKGA